MTTNRSPQDSDDDLLVKQVENLIIEIPSSKIEINQIAELMTMNRSPQDSDDHLLVREAENLTTKDNEEGSQYRRYELSDQVFPLSPEEATKKLGQLRVLIGSAINMKNLPNRKHPESFTFSESTSRIVRKVDVLSVHKGLKRLDKSNTRILTTLMGLLIENLRKSPSTSPLFLRTLYYMLLNEICPNVSAKRNVAGLVSPKNITMDKVTEYVDSLCCFFRCPRESLGVMACDTDSSFVGGVILGREDIDSEGKLILENGMALNQPYRINYHNIKNAEPTNNPPQFILLVEKMTVFDALCSLRFHRKFRCVIITGSGQPTVECRLFVKMIQKSLGVPVFVLVDCNPYGIEIFKSYKYGSTHMAFMSRNLVVPSGHIRMIGLFHSDLAEHGILETDMMSLEPADRKKGEKLLDESWMSLEPLIKKSLESSIKSKTKADLEILFLKIGYTSWIDKYLKEKILSNLQEPEGASVGI